MRTKLILLSICLLLATTAGLVIFNISFKVDTIYLGVITIESQEEYAAFVKALSREDIKINGLYYPLDTPYGLQITYLPEGEHYAYSLPARIGFDLQTLSEDPTAGLPNVMYYSEVMYEINHKVLLQVILSLCIAGIGYGLALLAWISRNGIYQKQEAKRK